MKAVLKPNSLLSQCGAGSGARVPAFVSGSKPWRPRGFLPGQVAPAAHAGPPAPRLVLAPGAPVVALGTRRCRPLSRRGIPPEPSDPGPLPSQRRAGGANSRRRRTRTRGPFQEASVRGKLGTDLPGPPALGFGHPAPKLCGQRCSWGQACPPPPVPRPAFPFLPGLSPCSAPAASVFPGVVGRLPGALSYRRSSLRVPGSLMCVAACVTDGASGACEGTSVSVVLKGASVCLVVSL